MAQQVQQRSTLKAETKQELQSLSRKMLRQGWELDGKEQVRKVRTAYVENEDGRFDEVPVYEHSQAIIKYRA